jgi:hypothetical protein
MYFKIKLIIIYIYTNTHLKINAFTIFFSTTVAIKGNSTLTNCVQKMNSNLLWLQSSKGQWWQRLKRLCHEIFKLIYSHTKLHLDPPGFMGVKPHWIRLRICRHIRLFYRHFELTGVNDTTEHKFDPNLVLFISDLVLNNLPPEDFLFNIPKSSQSASDLALFWAAV